jgi:hypothetical protein
LTSAKTKKAYLLPDRLCFAPGPPDADQQQPRARVRYLPLDRLAARPRHGPAGSPGLGLARLRAGLVSHPPGAPSVLALSAGGRTHYLAVATPHAADAWVDAIGRAWEACILDGGPRSAFGATEPLAATAATGTTTTTSTTTSTMSAAEPAWAAAAAEPPPAPAATPRGGDDGFTTPVRAWR